MSWLVYRSTLHTPRIALRIATGIAPINAVQFMILVSLHTITGIQLPEVRCKSALDIQIGMQEQVVNFYAQVSNS